MIPYRSLRLASASHLPLAGEDSRAPLHDHPGEGRGPIGEVGVTECRLKLATFPNWAPAFAGVVQVGWSKYCKYLWRYTPLLPLI